MTSLMLQPAARTDTGRRSNNEDAVFATPRLVAVVDGVGGAVAGEVASQLAFLAMASLEKRRLLGDLETELRGAVAAANETLGFVVSCRPQLAGMSTTLTAVGLSNDGHYLVANIGDSRTYLYRDGRLGRLTRDDSLIQELLDCGAITPEQARTHPQRSVVLDALDGAPRDIPPLTRLEACCGDRLLLCSDGLSDYVTDGQIGDILADRSRDAAVRELVRLALFQGGRDNISAIVADVVHRCDPAEGWLSALGA